MENPVASEWTTPAMIRRPNSIPLPTPPSAQPRGRPPPPSTPPPPPTAALYTQEALAAVGRGLSPTHVTREIDALLTHSKVRTAHPAMWQNEEEEAIFTRRPFDNNNSASQKLSKRSTQPICKYTITVIRAWGLAEMLGGTHAYVTASSSSCHTAIQRTPTIHNTTQPYFGSTLELEMIVDPSLLSNGERLEDTHNILLLSVFNRNGSLSDDMLGFAEVTFGSLFGAQDPHLVVDYSVNQVISSGVQVVYLVDVHNHTAGCLEISLTRQILLGGHLND